jgi:6-phosphogluconolactonase (cycloisomerase 2 family)
MVGGSEVNSQNDDQPHAAHYSSYGSKGASTFALLPLNLARLPEQEKAHVVTVEGHGPHPVRQVQSHCHQVQFHGDHLYGVDLGTDTISIYAYKDGLKLIGDRIRTRPGAGPRHFLFDQERSLVFLANEVDSTTDVYRVDSTLAQWQHLQTISTRQNPGLIRVRQLLRTHLACFSRFHHCQYTCGNTYKSR